MQVIDSTNFEQLVTTGKVPDFVAPAAPAAEAKAEVKADDKPRADDGTFKAVDKPDEKADKGTTAAADAATETKADDPPATDDPDDEDLPEKVRKKIGAKHRAMKEAEEFGEREFNRRKSAEQRVAQLEQELAQAKTKSVPAQDSPVESSDPAEPKPEDFKTVAEYARAVIKYEKSLDAKADAEKATKSAAETEFERLGASFKKQETEVIAANPDYREVVAKFDPTDMPGHIPQYLIESGPLLTYHFAKLPLAERSRIAQLSPIRAIAELGKLEAKLEKPAPKQEEPAKTPAVSRAPSPITPLSGDGTVPVNKDPATMTLQELREYERTRSAEQRSRR